MNWTAPMRILVLLALLALLPGTPGAAASDMRTDAPASAGPVIKRGLVVLVEFPDVPHDDNKELVRTRFTGHLGRYVGSMSYGRVALSIDVTPKLYRLPEPVSRYRISPRNLEVDKSRIHKLIDDALDAAGKDVDLSRYDFIALMLGAKVSEYGMVGLCGYPGMLGWSTEDAFRTTSGREVRGGVAIFTSQAHLGTLFHDVAHILGGVKGGKRMVPCLYDHDLQAKPGPMRETFLGAIINMGYWDPMSCHFHKRELPPPGISSWTKLRLGWLDPAKVRVIPPGQTAEVVLGPLEDGGSETLAIRIPVDESTYYLVENRQPLGFDQFLPGSGVLIMRADDRVAECRFGRSPVKLMDANPAIPRLEGAAFDVGAKAVFQDTRNNITIRILEKVGNSYRIVVARGQ
ncbi:MAG: hypothetical protein CVU73_14675 [Deltaproteobacteria bacterium HGW-Deltaproteobacteria-8]|jgi:M6 family metalloprotease-like protein|nr:MAG: hypothetical protein CVU73_14675 [Deltaproteobacteria bacterium HGW-Deltaproteobacteria-8]